MDAVKYKYSKVTLPQKEWALAIVQAISDFSILFPLLVRNLFLIVAHGEGMNILRFHMAGQYQTVKHADTDYIWTK